MEDHGWSLKFKGSNMVIHTWTRSLKRNHQQNYCSTQSTDRRAIPPPLHLRLIPGGLNPIFWASNLWLQNLSTREIKTFLVLKDMTCAEKRAGREMSSEKGRWSISRKSSLIKIPEEHQTTNTSQKHTKTEAPRISRIHAKKGQRGASRNLHQVVNTLSRRSIMAEEWAKRVGSCCPSILFSSFMLVNQLAVGQNAKVRAELPLHWVHCSLLWKTFGCSPLAGFCPTANCSIVPCLLMFLCSFDSWWCQCCCCRGGA